MHTRAASIGVLRKFMRWKCIAGASLRLETNRRARAQDARSSAAALNLHPGRGGGLMRTLLLILVLMSTVLMGGCELIGDIFQAGIAVGVIMVVIVVALIAFLARKLRR